MIVLRTPNKHMCFQLIMKILTLSMLGYILLVCEAVYKSGRLSLVC